MNVTLHQGSILDSEADFIVNPANSHLRHDGGLARVIANAAAPLANYRTMDDAYYAGHNDVGLWQQDVEWAMEQVDAPLVPTGGATITSPGRLPFKGVIHAVGPVWGGGRFFESSLLMMAHTSAITIAQDNGGESIAFPAVSCGIFGYPVEQASFTAILACRASRIPVEFWLFEDAHMEAFTKSLARVIHLCEQQEAA